MNVVFLLHLLFLSAILILTHMFSKQDVRVDTQLNRFLWSKGCRNVPRLVRIRVTRTKNEDDEAKEKFYSTVQLLEVESFAGLQTENK